MVDGMQVFNKPKKEREGSDWKLPEWSKLAFIIIVIGSVFVLAYNTGGYSQNTHQLLDLNSSLLRVEQGQSAIWLGINYIAEQDRNTQLLIGLNVQGVQCLQAMQGCSVIQDNNVSRIIACPRGSG